MGLRFEFDELRATQAAALLVQRAGGRMNYTKLIKLLYLADRESLLRTGTTITGAAFCCMTHGPVLSQVYDCIKHPTKFPTWNRFLAKPEQYHVTLSGDPGDSELSDFDVETLDGLATKYAAFSFSQLIDVVHELPEWEDPGEGACKPLEPSSVLRAAAVDGPTIKEFECQNSHMTGIQRMFGQ